MPNLRKNENLHQRSVQNSCKRMKRIDLRQNLVKKWKQYCKSLVYDREEMKMRCTDCADFFGEKKTNRKVS
jgi:hypothetical protein